MELGTENIREETNVELKHFDKRMTSSEGSHVEKIKVNDSW
jgi:hypothetical protein